MCGKRGLYRALRCGAGIGFDSGMSAWQGSRPPPPDRGSPLAIPELGSKQICPNCQAKFYDLNRRPAVCPKCHTDFDPDEALRTRRVRVRAVAPEVADEEREDQVEETAEREEEEEEEEVAPELDAAIDEPVLVADDEDEEPEPGVSPVTDDDLTEFTEEEELDDEDDVPFLEEDEDDFDDSEIEGLPDNDDDR